MNYEKESQVGLGPIVQALDTIPAKSRSQFKWVALKQDQTAVSLIQVLYSSTPSPRHNNTEKKHPDETFFIAGSFGLLSRWKRHWESVRLHSAIGYISPADKLAGRDRVIFKERDRKLEEARELRKQKRQQAFPEISHSGKADLPLDQAA